jgi:hypothetical protein
MIELEIKKRKGPKRVIFTIPEGLHKEMKIRCVLKNVSITKYILQAVLEKLERDKRYD